MVARLLAGEMSNPAMMDKLPYADKDFEAIELLAKVPMVFAISSKVPAKNLAEFLALAKARPASAVMAPRASAAPATWPSRC